MHFLNLNFYRFTNEQDKEKFYALMGETLKENFPDVKVTEHNYFIDFMREAPEVRFFFK